MEEEIGEEEESRAASEYHPYQPQLNIRTCLFVLISSSPPLSTGSLSSLSENLDPSDEEWGGLEEEDEEMVSSCPFSPPNRL